MGTYRVDQSYEVNYELGPDHSSPFPAVPPTPTKMFLGRPVRSRLGIAAGLLLNSKWIGCYARLGYDLVTYKTVRSAHRPCYPPPNWVRVAAKGGLPDDADAPLVTIEPTAVDRPDATWAVCFGMPSMAPKVWRADIGRARRTLAQGQLLNVSVVGTPTAAGGLDELADDFARCAAWAAESGADLVEANFSCPNVCTAEGQIYQDAAASRQVAERIRQAIGSTPLLVKAGPFGEGGRLPGPSGEGRLPGPSEDKGRMAEFFRSLSGLANAVVLVNAIPRKVHRPDGTPAFGPYERVGIVGAAIHDDCVRIVEQAARIVDREEMGLAVCGVGGIASAAQARRFLDAGAAAVFLGSFPMVHPHLAVEIKAADPDI